MTLLTFSITLGRGPDARVLHVATQSCPPCRLKAEAIGRVA